MKTITFCSFKGGTAKTSSSVNIGCSLSCHYNKRVLLIDLDPQSNLTTSLGQQEKSNYRVENLIKNECSIHDVIKKTNYKKLDMIGSSIFLENFRESFSIQEDDNFCFSLRNSLKEVSNNYDVCIIDTPPSLGRLTKMAFLASSDIVVCITPDPLSILGLQKIKDYLDLLLSYHKLNVLGVIMSFWDKRNSTNATYLDIVESFFPKKLFSKKIRRDVFVSRSILKEKPVFEAYPLSRASEDFKELTKELRKKLFIKKVDLLNE